MSGGKYVVEIQGNGHPISAGLDGVSFTDSNDIDLSTPRNEGETIVTATISVLDGDDSTVCEDSRPVVVGFEP